MKKNNKINDLDRDIFICKCGSLEHQYSFYYSKDDGVWFEPHLNTSLSFFKRIKLAIYYIFGYKTKYGSWDGFFINEKDSKLIIKYLKKSKNVD